MMENDKNSTVFNQFINQKELMKELRIGFGTLQKLRLNGLKSVQIGRQKYYNIDDVKNVFNQLKK